MSSQSKDEEKAVFMFIVKPNDNLSYDEGTWNGEVNEISRLTKGHTKTLEKEITKHTD